jgi:hypothetical protein
LNPSDYVKKKNPASSFLLLLQSKIFHLLLLFVAPVPLEIGESSSLAKISDAQTVARALCLLVSNLSCEFTTSSSSSLLLNQIHNFSSAFSSCVCMHVTLAARL